MFAYEPNFEGNHLASTAGAQQALALTQVVILKSNANLYTVAMLCGNQGTGNSTTDKLSKRPTT